MTDKKHDRRAFDAAMRKTLNDSINRMNTFQERAEGQILYFLLAKEALLIMDKIHLLDPDMYAKAIKDHRMFEHKTQRGFCGSVDCFQRLLPVDQWDRYPKEVRMHLLDFCPTCAEEGHKELDNDPDVS
jgi:hypothetical protein